MYHTTCCVRECPSEFRIPSHQFPKNAERFNKSKAAVYSQKIAHLTDDELRNCRVCHKHFLESDYVPNLVRRRLNRDAVPSLHLKNCGENVENTTVIASMHIEVPQGIEQCPSISECMHVEVPQSAEQCPSTLECMHMEVPQSTEECASTTELVAQECRNETPPPVKRKRMSVLTSGIKRVHLTPQKARLYATAKYFRRRQIAVEKQLSTTRERLRDAARYYSSASTQQLLGKLTPTQQTFIEMQLRSVKNKPKGRRYSLDEKILCLSLYKQSRRCYKLLSHIFNLPCPKVLQTLLKKVKLEPGINSFLFKHLAEQAERMQDCDRVCYLMWDEIALQSHLAYSQSLDCIVGVEDYGGQKTQNIADTALVFMLRGVKTGWKLPLAFYFCDGQMKSDYLVEQINAIVFQLAQTMLKLIAFVCDQGSSNVKAINLMVESTGHPDGIITLHGYNIIPLFDPPHLIKGVRNNLLNKDLEIDININSKGDRKFASWKTVQLAYEMSQVDSPMRPLQHITDEQIYPQCIKKMRVKNAVQILSNRMASFISYETYRQQTIMSINGPLTMPINDGRATAEALMFFNNLFDSVNGQRIKGDVPLRSAVTNTSEHHEFWKHAIEKLENMRFVKPDDKTPTKGYLCLKNWIKTIKGFILLKKALKKENIGTLKPRYINQDPLENFFGCIRALGCRNTKPTCLQFAANFKTLLLNNLLSRSVQGNCERACEGSLLFTLRQCITSGTDEADLHSANPQWAVFIVRSQGNA